MVKDFLWLKRMLERKGSFTEKKREKEKKRKKKKKTKQLQTMNKYIYFQSYLRASF
jgi:hypothetical protein